MEDEPGCRPFPTMCVDGGRGEGAFSRRQFLEAGLGLALAGALGGGPFAAPLLAAPAAAGSPLKLGELVPLTGFGAAAGEDFRRGFRLYLERAGNQAGGRPFQIVTEDETADPSTALAKATKLIQSDRVDLLVGILSSASAYAVRDLVHTSRTLTVVGIAFANDLTRARKSPHVFRASATNWQVNSPLGRWVGERLSKRAAMLSSDFAAGREANAAFREGFAAAGGEIVDESYIPLGTTDFSSALARLTRTMPPVLFGFLPGTDGVVFLRQFAQSGLKGRVTLAVSGPTVEEDVIRAVGEAALGAYSTSVWAVSLVSVQNREFVQSYQRRYSAGPSHYSVYGYDSAHVIVDAINAVRGDTGNKEQLLQAVERVRFASPRGLFEFDPATHNVIQNIYVRRVGRYTNALANVHIDNLGRIRDPG